MEGYSNLLWVLACAAMGKLGFDLIDGARILGIFGMSASIAAVVYAFRPKQATIAGILPAVAAILVLILSGTMAVWMIGGLEQPFVAAFLAWMLVLLYPLIRDRGTKAAAFLLPGLFGGLLCLTRPDSPLFIAAACIAMLLIVGVHRRTFAIMAAFILIPVVCVGAQLAFRRVYYDEWLPNTAYVKIAFSLNYLLHGGFYLAGGTVFMAPLVGVIIIGSWLGLRKRIRRDAIIFFIVPLIFWSIYVFIIGGDVFPARRHCTPLVIFSAFFAGEVVRYFVTTRRASRIVQSLAIACLLLGTLQYLDFANRRALDERWEWRGKTVALELADLFARQQPLLAVDPAGCIPYWSGFPCIDMLGLNDYFIAHHPPPDFGDGHIGHGMGNGAYVLIMNPDIIVFGETGLDSAIYQSGLQMQHAKEFYRRYALVRMRIQDSSHSTAPLWMNTASAKLGMHSDSAILIIPAWQANGNVKTEVEPDAHHALAAVVSSTMPARLNGIELCAGAWHAEIDPPDTAVHIEISADTDTNSPRNDRGYTFHQIGSEYVRIELSTADSAEHDVETIRLVRTNDDSATQH